MQSLVSFPDLLLEQERITSAHQLAKAHVLRVRACACVCVLCVCVLRVCVCVTTYQFWSWWGQLSETSWPQSSPPVPALSLWQLHVPTSTAGLKHESNNQLVRIKVVPPSLPPTRPLLLNTCIPGRVPPPECPAQPSPLSACPSEALTPAREEGCKLSVCLCLMWPQILHEYYSTRWVATPWIAEHCWTSYMYLYSSDNNGTSCTPLFKYMYVLCSFSPHASSTS